jgi:hypothetical protein
MMEIIKKNKNTPESVVIHVVVSWIMFSIFYWIAAYFKPFHCDEFFSWVYVERSSFKDILMLKDTGIGHPPLFHLLQKFVQTVSPSYHFLQVRLVNYVAGSAFVILFAVNILRDRWLPVLCYGVACSAGLLNIFVFSRMWGLVALCALLGLRFGEDYVNTKRTSYLILFLAACAVGFFSDYSFILIFPYALTIILVALNRSRLTTLVMGVFGVAGITGPLIYAWTQRDPGYFAYHITANVPRMAFEAANSLLNFWFAEPFLFFVGMVVVAWIVGDRIKAKGDNARKIKLFGNWSACIFGILILVEALIRYTPIRTRHVAPLVIAIIIAWLVTGYLVVKKHLGSVDWSGRNVRLLFAVFGAMIILVTISPFFWRDLRVARFLSVVVPFIMYLIFLNAPRSTIILFSAAMVVSGVLFIFSKGLGDYFPPPSFEKRPQPVYQNVFGYSTQYMKSSPSEREEPIFLDLFPFKQSCRTCTMGIAASNLYLGDVLYLVARDDYKLSWLESKGYSVVSKELIGVSWLDKVQFSYLTPIYPRCHAEYTLVQEPESKRNAPFELR